jgi:hypothetical protein
VTPRRFYFQIKAANVLECITASQPDRGQAIAAETGLPWWSQIEWINPEPLPIQLAEVQGAFCNGAWR